MKTVYIDSVYSMIHLVKDCAYLRPNLIIFDVVRNVSESAFNIMMYKDCHEFDENDVFVISTYFFNTDEELLKLVDNLQEHQKQYHKCVKINKKNAAALKFIFAYKQSFNALSKELKFKIEYTANKYFLVDLLPFVEEEIWEAGFFDGEELKNQESPFIGAIVNSIITPDEILSLDINVEDLFSFALMDSENVTAVDFLKVPFWRLPPMISATAAELKYTRNDLKPLLVDFQNQIGAVSEALKKIDYTKENIPEIKRICKEKLFNFDETVQKKIDDSLYVSKLRNTLPDKTGVTLCIGITSAATLVNYFEKNKIAEPYIANEIRDQLSKHIALGSTQIFAYYEFYPPFEYVKVDATIG